LRIQPVQAEDEEEEEEEEDIDEVTVPPLAYDRLRCHNDPVTK
jgi:hypothetical protein